MVLLILVVETVKDVENCAIQCVVYCSDSLGYQRWPNFQSLTGTGHGRVSTNLTV